MPSMMKMLVASQMTATQAAAASRKTAEASGVTRTHDGR
jgi:hypothetical protein